MLDLILINDYYSKNLPYSFGKATLAAFLIRKGWKIKIIQYEDVPKLGNVRTRFFGLGSWSLEFWRVVQVSTFLKQRYPHIPVICGGVHATACPSDLEKHADLFDYWVLGEGEIAIHEILQGQHQPQTHIQRPVTVQDLILPPVNLNPVSSGLHFHLASRGCTHTCTFCNTPELFGRHIRHIPLGYYIDHIKYLLANGMTTIFLNDSSFFNDLRWATDFCNTLIHEKIRLNWIANCCAEQLTESTLALAKKAGCIGLRVGIESGDPAILNIMHKNYRLTETQKAMTFCKNNGIFVHAFFIYGALGESKETMAATRNFYDQIKPDSISLSIYRPFPGTAMFDEASKMGLLNKYNWSTGCPAQLLFTGHMTQEKAILEADKLWGGKPLMQGFHDYKKQRWNNIRFIPGAMAHAVLLKISNSRFLYSILLKICRLMKLDDKLWDLKLHIAGRCHLYFDVYLRMFIPHRFPKRLKLTPPKAPKTTAHHPSPPSGQQISGTTTPEQRTQI